MSRACDSESSAPAQCDVAGSYHLVGAAFVAAKMEHTISNVTCYIGDPIENPQEVRFLRKLERDLAAQGLSAYVFANFYAGRPGNRQVDFLIFTAERLTYVELKSFDVTRPIIGGANGRWLQQGPGDAERSLDSNPYQQARSGTFAVSDSMKAFAMSGAAPDADRFYRHIDTVVCFDPVIPNRSELQVGDYVSYLGYEDLIARLNQRGRRPPWSDAQWEAFAAYLGVYREDAESGSNGDQRMSTSVLEEYRWRFRAAQSLELPAHVPTTMHAGDVELSVSQLVSFVAEGRLLSVVGGHGAGKSHLARHLAIALSDAGMVVLWLRAGEYAQGQFGRLLSKSAASFSPENFSNLLEHATRAAVDVAVVLDGVNECPQQLRSELVDQLAGLRLRTPGGAIITSLEGAPVPESMAAIGVVLGDPTPDERRRILESYGMTCPDLVSEAFRTPYELSIAASCHAELGDATTQVDLFDAYVRKLARSEVVRAGLRAIAAVMDAELRTSLRVLDVALALGSHSGLELPPERVDEIMANDLLVSSQGRVQFRHELLGRFLAAEDCVLRSSTGQALGAALRTEQHRDLHHYALIIERDVVRRADALAELADARLYLAAATGVLGSAAAFQASAAICGVLADATFATNPESASFVPNDWPGGEWATKQSWSANELALLTAAGLALAKGLFVDEVCSLIDATDELFLGQVVNMQNAGSTTTISPVFAATYTQFASLSVNRLGASVVSYACETDWLRDHNSRVPVVRRFLQGGTSRPWGRLYLALHLFDAGSSDDRAVLPELLLRAWKIGGYHLRLDALDVAIKAAWMKSSAERQAVASVLSEFETENVFLSSMLVEALAAYDLIVPMATVASLTHEIAEFLTRPDDPDTWKAAARFVDLQFDNEAVLGPYYETIHSLSESDRRELLIAAARSGEGVWASWTLERLADEAPSGEPALDERLRSVFAGPASRIEATGPMIQDNIAVHLAGLRGWARLSSGAPPYQEEGDADERAWRLVDRLVLDLERQRGIEDVNEVWRELLGPLAAAAVDVMFRLSWAQTLRPDDPTVQQRLIERFPSEMRALMEWGVVNRGRLTSHFPAGAGHSRANCILRILGQVGNEATVALLRPYLIEPKIATDVVAAIRAINAHR
jgi:hypothetical protein